MPMTTRTLTATAVTLAALPVALGALLWRGLQLQDRRFVDLDPFEVDLQLLERNDEA